LEKEAEISNLKERIDTLESIKEIQDSVAMRIKTANSIEERIIMVDSIKINNKD
jgi:hypothetical protein